MSSIAVLALVAALSAGTFILKRPTTDPTPARQKTREDQPAQSSMMRSSSQGPMIPPALRAQPPSPETTYDMMEVIKNLREAYSRLETPAARYAFLLGIIQKSPNDPHGLQTRRYAIRLMGVAAAEDETVAREAFPFVLQLARNDLDPPARAMAIGAVLGVCVPLHTSSDPNFILYVDPDYGSGDPFDRGFPEWARRSPEYTSLLQDLTQRATDPEARKAAVCARAFLGDVQSVRDLSQIIVDTSESQLLRILATNVLYKTASDVAWPLISQLALGSVQGMPDGFQIQALKRVIEANQADLRHETAIAQFVSDSSADPGVRKQALGLAGDLYASAKSVGSRSLLLSGCADPDRDLRIHALYVIEEFGDRTFAGDLEKRAAVESDTFVLDTINGLLNNLEPQGKQRPSLHFQMVQLQKQLAASTDIGQRDRITAELKRVFDQMDQLGPRKP